MPGLILRLGISVGVQFEATDLGIFLRLAVRRGAGAQLGNSIHAQTLPTLTAPLRRRFTGFAWKSRSW